MAGVAEFDLILADERTTRLSTGPAPADALRLRLSLCWGLSKEDRATHASNHAAHDARLAEIRAKFPAWPPGTPSHAWLEGDAADAVVTFQPRSNADRERAAAALAERLRKRLADSETPSTVVLIDIDPYLGFDPIPELIERLRPLKGVAVRLDLGDKR